MILQGAHESEITIDNHGSTTLAELTEHLTHKLRNQLSVITAASSQLNDNIGDKIDPDDASLLNAVIIAADRIDEIIYSFIQYACPETPRPIDMNLNDICRREFDHQKTQAGGDRYPECTLDLDDSLPHIFCDPDQLRLILSSLLSNAIENAGSGTSIILSTQAGSDSVVLTIQNPGPSVESNYRKTAFKPFVSSRSTSFGLGLSIANRLAHENGGRIDIDWRDEGGAIVKLRLPIMKKTEE